MSRVGITGHQGLKPWVERVVSDRMREALKYESNLVGVTSLAAGADQIFARIVLAFGGNIEVILPTPAYREAFSKPEELAACEDLLARAVKTIILPFPLPSEGAFMAAGRAVVDRSDLLMAVWNGKPAGGLGGTADVIAYAHECGVAVVNLWPEGTPRE